MAYKILNTDGTTLLLLADNTVNQSATSLALVGKNINAYGQYINNNFVRLLANSASSSSSPPRSPLTGQLWFDTTSRRLKVYDGTFRPVSGAVVSSPSVANPPTPVSLTNPSAGDLWWDKDNFQLNVWDGSVWTTVGPTFPAYYGQDSGWVLPPYQNPVNDLGNVKQFVALLKNHHTTLGVLSTNSFVTTYSEFTATVNTSTVIVESGLTLFNSLKVYNTVTSAGIVTINFTAKNIVSTGTVTSTNLVSTSATITNFTATNATLTNVVVTSKLSMGSNKITNMADPIADTDAVTRQYLYGRSIVLSIDISDGLNNSGIINYLAQIAPVAEYKNGTNARILCSTVTVSSSTVTLSTTTSTFMITPSTTGPALTGATASASIPTVSVARVVKTFTISGGAWTFVS